MYTVDNMKIKETMKKKRWSASDIHALSGLSFITIKKVIEGTAVNPSFNTIFSIAKCLEIPLEELVIEVKE